MKKSLKLMLGGAFLFTAAKALDTSIEVSKYTVSSEKLPIEFDNFKIAHISDYHNGPADGLYEILTIEKPDIICMSGDMTSDKKEETYLPAVKLISHLTKIAPCFIVSGNHDTWRTDFHEYVKQCREAGAYFLENEYFKLCKSGKHIIISGMQDVFTKVNPAEKATEYLKYFSVSEEYQIFLFHRANLLDTVKDFGFDLILSGHLHGGQIRLPLVGGVCAPLSSLSGGERIIFPKYTAGMFKYGKTVMIVNRGLGNPIPLPRVFNRPEVGIITLKSNRT